MRQRKIKDIEEKITEYRDLIIENPAEHKCAWRQLFREKSSIQDDTPEGLSEGKANTGDSGAWGEKKLFVEIGCGKGQFITSTAKDNPEDLFIAIEGFSSVIYRALQKVREEGLENVLFICDFVFDLGTWFVPGELDGVFLNFSDPWPKKKNAKRRLTYRDRLEQYALALKPGGFLRFKTDNDEFFDFTLTELDAVLNKCGYEVEYETRNLHGSPWANKSPMTEYETKFSETGKDINFISLRKTN